MTSLSKEEDNFIRLSLLVEGIAERAVRCLFDKEFTPSILQRALNPNTRKILWEDKIINMTQYDILSSKPDSKKFDISLMITLLTNIAHIHGIIPYPTQKSMITRADLAKIRYVSNYLRLAHLVDSKVDNSSFETHWKDISDAIGRLGGRDLLQECVDLRSKMLSMPDTKYTQEEKPHADGKFKEPIAKTTDDMIRPLLPDDDMDTILECNGICVHLLVNNATCRKIATAQKDAEVPSTSHSSLSRLFFLQMNFLNNSLTTETLSNMLHWSIHEREDVVCRYILTKATNTDQDIDCIRTTFAKAVLLNAQECAKAIAWHIVRLFVKSNRHNLKFCTEMWPGIRCKCSKGNDKFDVCSSEMVIVIEHYNKCNCNLPSHFYGVEIKDILKSENGRSLEAERIPGTYDYTTHGIDSESAEHLFENHSKLYVISPSSFKSTGFPFDQKFKESDCIQLFCKIKGIIPVGEPHFPSKTEGRATDVLSGASFLLTKNIKIGDEVASETSSGTLGGFVRFLGEDTFLTCAHVVFGIETVMSSAKTKQKMAEAVEIGVRDHAMPVPVKCGRVRHVLFKEGNKNETSIDAALVAVDTSVASINAQAILSDNTGSFKSVSDIGIKSVYINESFVDEREIGTNPPVQTMSVGFISKFQTGCNRKVVEDEKRLEFEKLTQSYQDIEQNNPKPFHVCQDVHHRIQLEELGKKELSSRRVCTFYKQIAFRNIAFQPGDSGTCIYVLNGQDNKYYCIGMAAATHPDGGCIVTPMKAILEAFGLQ